MTVFARIAPNRVTQRLSFLIVDPHAVEGLALMTALRKRGMSADMSTSVAHGLEVAHRNQHSVVVVKSADAFTVAELALLAGLSSTRSCFVLADRESDMATAVRRGYLDAKLVPATIELTDLLSAVRWALQSTARRRATSATPERAQVSESTETEACSVTPLRVTHCVMRPVRRKTRRYIPAVSYKYDR